MDAPDSLYRYQALSAYSLAALVNKTIWLAKPSTFNDPFDCAITLDRQKYKQSVMHAVSVAMERAKPAGLNPEHLQDMWPGDEEAFEQFRSHLTEMVQNLGICSFSATSTHLLMWSHYANHHRGFCVEYDCRAGTKLRKLAYKVKYEDTVPSLTAADFAPPENEGAVDTLWLTKAKCWAYEEEWRVMTNEGNKAHRAPSRILSVIFGARMPESDRIMVAYALRHEPDVNFKQARLKEGHFEVEVAPI
ncbi:MAG: DUF2971 domain-containing protein [Moraxellaceae bacterium]|nr:DUF2971 domain-containing protein [Moraxellaceae bacterium]